METKASPEEIKAVLEDFLGYELTQENSNTRFSGSTLSSGIYNQLLGAISAAFLLMAWVVFLIFSESRKVKAATTMITFLGISVALPGIPAIRIISGIGIFVGFVLGLFAKTRKKNEKRLFWISILASLILFFFYTKLIILIPVIIVLLALYTIYSIPSLAVILSAFADIVMTIALIDFLGFNLSLAGVIALLMLIGYSVDTDVLLTTRLLKRTEGSTNERMWEAFKTGTTMTVTSIIAVTAILVVIYSFSDIFRQIFSILLIGLSFDLMNTWLMNASVLRWYIEHKEAKL